MNFLFEWQEKLYLTNERRERVRYFSFQENIKFIPRTYLSDGPS